MSDSEQSYEARMSARSATTLMINPDRRRRWSGEQKLAIVRETLEPGAIMSLVARRHRIGTGQLYTWRKQLLAGAMAGFVPIELTSSPVPAAKMQASAGMGRVEIATTGGARVFVDCTVERATLSLVLSVIGELGQ